MAINELSIPSYAVALAPSDARSAFIRRTYLHLALAVAAFAGLELLFFGPLAETTESLVYSMVGGYSWLIVLGLFMVVGYVADRWARSDLSVGLQYLGLAVYVVAEAVLFLPLLYIAAHFTSPDVLPTAIWLTLALFVGLTATVFITRKDFSFLRTILTVGGFVALGIIVVAILFGFDLGVLFSAAMIALAAGYILYYTSAVMKHYRPDQHVAASLALFAAVALMFWYVLRLLMILNRR
ncbi:MAG: Bax inhibitor-1/YccA family protein [Deltaproteobacteria bacterium]|nr:Bax inhibitor-1/YccA family protein [Deltaproteobacteria bacterium]